jgi:hypothetical protein
MADLPQKQLVAKNLLPSVIDVLYVWKPVAKQQRRTEILFYMSYIRDRQINN